MSYTPEQMDMMRQFLRLSGQQHVEPSETMKIILAMNGILQPMDKLLSTDQSNQSETGET